MIGRTNVGGGSAGLSPRSAVIHVTAPVGSTISFSKGGVTVKVLSPEKSYIDSADSSIAHWCYSVSPNNYGTWTVTSTLGTKVSSGSVAVSAAYEYDIKMEYSVYLVKNGTVNVTFTKTGGTITSGTNYATFNSGGNDVRVAYYRVDVTQYSTLSFKIYNSSGRSWYPSFQTNTPSFGVATNTPTINSSTYAINGYTAYKKFTQSSGDYIQAGTYTLDISSYTGMMYVAMALSGTSSYSGQLNIADFWMQ